MKKFSREVIQNLKFALDLYTHTVYKKSKLSFPSIHGKFLPNEFRPSGKFHLAQTLKLGGTYKRDAGWFAFSRTLKTAHKSGFHMNFPSSFLDIL